MPELAAFQQAFARSLANGAAPAGLSGPPDITARRFAVYRNNIRLTRMAALRNAFPLVRNIVGDEFFDGLAREHATTHDSESGDLNQYGCAFAPFLAHFEPAGELPYLPDCARLDWQCHLACQAADGARLDPAQLGSIAPEHHSRLRLAAQPGVALLASPYPLAQIWRVNQSGYEGDMRIDFSGGEQYAMVLRDGFEVRVEALCRGEHAFLASVMAGQTLGAALDRALEDGRDFDFPAAFARWLAAGVFAGFSVDCA